MGIEELFDRGRTEIRSVVIDIAEVISRAVELTAPLYEQRRHQLTVTLERGLYVTGDPARLAQAIASLLTNAATSSAPGSRTSLRATRHGPAILLVVRDAGIGSSGEVSPHEFERFAQGTGEHPPGAELRRGLAIVEHLVELHGGRVTAERDGVAAGSAFTIELPAVDAPIARSGAARALRHTAQPRKILVVDDNTDVAEMMAEALGDLGHTVRAANDGPAALAAATEFAPDVALLDIGLPTMDGYEVARRMRAEPALDRAFLVAVTGYGRQSDRDRAKAAGFDAHLVKPVKLDQVLGLIDRLPPR